MFGPLLERLALALDREGIRYMVIGGQAVLVHGEFRATRDIDLTIRLSPAELPRALKVAETLRLRPLVEDPERFVRDTFVLPVLDSDSGIRIDLIFGISPYEAEAMERSHRVASGQAMLRIASPEDTIIHKLVAGRPRDLEDARGILRRQRRVDVNLIKRWLQEFDRGLGGDRAGTFEALWREVEGRSPGEA